MILALSGGVGGAKLAQGLAMVLPPESLLIVVNTGDDFVYLGLHISPDLDTVMYWLSRRNDPNRGWGLIDESWNFMTALQQLGGPTWFNLGDRDLACHVERTRRLESGASLSEVTRHLTQRLGISHMVAPMSDDRVRTNIHTPEGAIEFQQCFVRLRCEPRVAAITYDGASTARPSAKFDAALGSDRLEAVVICPSNPLLSVQSILQVGDVAQRIGASRCPVIAISPIIGGRALKGPADEIFHELGLEPTALGVARYYRDLVDCIVIDSIDADLIGAIEDMGMRVAVCDIAMRCPADQVRLAREVIDLAKSTAEAADV